MGNEIRCGLFLDLDGTLADSLPVMRGVYGAFLGEYGRTGSDAEFESLNGPPLMRICENLRQTHKLDDPADALYARYQAMIADARARIAPAAGAGKILEKAKANGRTVAVVTSALNTYAQSWLAEHQLSSMIDFVVGGDDVEQGKPQPEPYQLALRLSACDPDCSVAVEDSVQGALSASRAQLPTWLIAPALPEELADQPHICGCLPDFSSVNGLL